MPAWLFRNNSVLMPSFRPFRCCLILLAILICASCINKPTQQTPLCSKQTLQNIEQVLSSGDLQGHGPDIGSAEWMSAIEFKLGIKTGYKFTSHVPQGWCDVIIKAMDDKQLEQYNAQTMPSFDCSRDDLTTIETLICDSAKLSSTDRQLATIYTRVLEDYPANQDFLKAEQRGWIKGRNDCWKAPNKFDCTEQSYSRRIAELQAKYRLVSHSATLFYVCNNQPAFELVTTRFNTNPEIIIAELGDHSAVLFNQAHSNKFIGRNERIDVFKDHLLISWGEYSNVKCVANSEEIKR